MKRRLKSTAFSIVILAAVLAATVFGGVRSNGILPASALPSSVGFYAVSYLNIENDDGTAVPGTEATAGQAAKPACIGAFEAALAGVYIHGLAGDLAARELGEYGVTAGDLVLYTAYAMKKILSEV